MYASTSIETALSQMAQFQSEGTVELAKRLKILTWPQLNLLNQNDIHLEHKTHMYVKTKMEI